MKTYVLAVAVLHAVFAFCEMFPWASPVLLGLASKGLKPLTNLEKNSAGGSAEDKFTPDQKKLVATIVHNAGIYNVVMAASLVWAAFLGEPANNTSFVLLAGAGIAGAFGTATLRSPVTALQAAMGILGAIFVGCEIFK